MIVHGPAAERSVVLSLSVVLKNVRSYIAVISGMYQHSFLNLFRSVSLFKYINFQRPLYPHEKYTPYFANSLLKILHNTLDLTYFK